MMFRHLITFVGLLFSFVSSYSQIKSPEDKTPEIQNLMKIARVYRAFQLKNQIHSVDTVKFIEVHNMREFDNFFEISPFTKHKKNPYYPDFRMERVFCISLGDYNDSMAVLIINLERNKNELNVYFNLNKRRQTCAGMVEPIRKHER